MNKTSVAAGLAGALIISAFSSGTASAQTGAEITGHSVRVEFADGVTNTVWFEPNGTARIVSQTGDQVAGRWFVENQMLCLQTASARECWPYRTAFQAGQPVSLTSDCMATSSWTALSTEPLAPPPAVQRSGERG